jgi:hypothetical protein
MDTSNLNDYSRLKRDGERRESGDRIGNRLFGDCFKKRCKMKLKGCLAVPAVFIMALTGFGCATSGGNRYEALSQGDQGRMLEQIEKNWRDYDIYSDGPVGTTSAVIFDPKNDDRKLIGDGYIKLEDERSVDAAIGTIRAYVQFQPVLYRITDDQGRFYGFVYIASYLPSAGRIDAVQEPALG